MPVDFAVDRRIDPGLSVGLGVLLAFAAQSSDLRTASVIGIAAALTVALAWLPGLLWLYRVEPGAGLFGLSAAARLQGEAPRVGGRLAGETYLLFRAPTRGDSRVALSKEAYLAEGLWNTTPRAGFTSADGVEGEAVDDLTGLGFDERGS
jgi:hypothetical protein